jgi:hypothetical protein
MDNTSTIEIKQQDFIKFLDNINKKIKIVKLEDSD